jgi:hypothetical protein
MKPVTEYTPIRATKAGFCGRCRSCRAQRAWEKNHPDQRYEDRPLRPRIHQPEQPKARPVPTTRTCTDCGATKEIAEFVRIKECALGWYGDGRECRARRARERYQSDAEERERQKARVRRNRLRRLQSTLAPP